MTPADLRRGSIAEAAAWLRSGAARCADLVEACLEQIDRLDPQLHAFIHRRDDAARAAARAADEAIASGHAPSPLAGIPLAHKDMFLRAGEAASFGAHPGRAQRAASTSTVKARLDADRALDLGGLNMSEYAAGPTGDNAFHGRCANPWQPERLSGGSSSGSAAAVAARMIHGSVGSDTGGSIRIPAALCGVTGLKPTFGRVSRHGAMPRVWSQDSIGPIARSAADCAAILEAIAGPDGRDALVVADAPRFEWRPDAGVAVKRIKVLETPGAADGDVEACVASAIGDLERCGIAARPARWTDFDDVLALAEVVHKVEASALHDVALRGHGEEYSAFVRERFEDGLAISGVRYVQAQSLRAVMAEAFVVDVLGDCDAAVLPTVGCIAPFATAAQGAASDSRGLLSKLTRLTRPFSYLGLPAISIPCGFGDAGMPVGLQIVGRPFAEATIVSLAHAFQCATDWHRAAPPLAAA
jgi:aspartyl-tRNA(Asn)/glutamyl-tRNA(Gln) amidotransferase subunit A